MTKFFAYVAGALLAILPIVNPFGAVPLVMTVGQPAGAGAAAPDRRACVYTFLLMAGFLVAGGLIMSFFGISIPGMRIAGGIIVAFLGFQMLFPERAVAFKRAQGRPVQVRHRLYAARNAGPERVPEPLPS